MHLADILSTLREHIWCIFSDDFSLLPPLRSTRKFKISKIFGFFYNSVARRLLKAFFSGRFGAVSEQLGSATRLALYCEKRRTQQNAITVFLAKLISFS